MDKNRLCQHIFCTRQISWLAQEYLKPWDYVTNPAWYIHHWSSRYVITIILFEYVSVSAHCVVFPSLTFQEKTGVCLSPLAESSSQHQPAETGTLYFARLGRSSWRSGWLSPPEGRDRGSLDCPESRCRAASGWAGERVVDGGERSPWWPDNHLFLGSRGSSSLPAPGPSAACRRRPKHTPEERVKEEKLVAWHV